MNTDNFTYIPTMADVARAAGQCLMAHFADIKSLPITVKGPGDFVSKADHESEAIIFKMLKDAYPDFGFLMEESGAVDGAASAGYRWVIDPLDGTTNFLHGIPHWAISIALESADEGIVAAVLYSPAQNEMFYAEKGKGAFLNGQALDVSHGESLATAVVSGAGPTMKRTEGYAGEYVLQLTALLQSVAGFRCKGAASLDLAYVAAGRYESCWCNDLMPWDIAAGSLLVQESGGTIKTVKENAGNPVYAGDIVAGTPVVTALVHDLLRTTSVTNKPGQGG